jgi:hypothetical protein
VDKESINPPDDWVAMLSHEGRGRAEAAAKRHSAHDLAGLVEVWAACSRRIGRDEGEDYYDDYFYYLSQREAVAAVIVDLSEADAAVVRRAVEPADAYFRACTFDDGGVALGRKFRPPSDEWYWRRLPKTGSIAQSLGR